MNDPQNPPPVESTTVVVGAGRGLGRGIALAVADGGGRVVSLSRTAPAPVAGVLPVLGDAADAALADRLLAECDPDAVVLVAGASPPMMPLQDHTWESFSVNWHADVRIAFTWLQAVLRKPLRPGGRVVVVSSGAALAGSPLSGGYAGAKAAQRFMAGYARDEIARAGLGIVVTTVLPRLTPLTDLGREAVAAYAAREGLSVDEYLARQPGRPLTPDAAGDAVAAVLRADPADLAAEYLLTSEGLRPLP